MAKSKLTACRVCEAEVATRAKTCPHCGIKNPGVTKSALIGAWVLMLAMLGGCVAVAASIATRDGEDAVVEVPGTATELAESCFSAWDGNHDGLEALIRARLNDPGSMETHGTYYNPDDSLDDGEIGIRLDYGARNALGGMVRTNAYATMGLDCEIVNVTDYGF